MRQEDEKLEPDLVPPEPDLVPPEPPVPALLTYDEKAARYQVFMENRKALFDSLVEVSGRFTQWSLTLAGGGLALSMTYVEKLQPETSTGKYWLVGSWGLLSLSLLSSLLSLHYSTKSTKSAIIQADEEYRAWEKGTAITPTSQSDEPIKWTNFYAKASMWMFGLGVSSMAIFVLICPPSSKKDDDKKIIVNVTLTPPTTPASQGQKTSNNQDDATKADTSAKPDDTTAKPDDTTAKP